MSVLIFIYTTSNLLDQSMAKGPRPCMVPRIIVEIPDGMGNLKHAT